MTPDGPDYTDSFSNGVLTVSAATNAGGNNREFMWASGAPTETASTVCATFTSGQGIDQQGVVLLINLNSTDGAVTAVTVTRNIYAEAFNVFNFHVWNTADTSNPFTQFGSFTASNLPAYPAPAVYPLHLCARTAFGYLQFVEWTSDVMPAWGTAGQGGLAPLPSSAPSAGQDGFFAGHEVAGTSMTYRDLTIDGSTTNPTS